MTLAASLKLAGTLAVAGLVGGMAAGFLVGPARMESPGALAVPVPDVQAASAAADPIGALAAQLVAPQQAVNWTTAPQRVERRAPTSSTPVQPDVNARAPEPPAIVGVAATRGSAVGEMPAGPTANYTRLEFVEAGAFRAIGRTIRFADIEPVALDQTCPDAGGAEWPCGRRALAALRDLVRQRPVQCVEVGTEGAASIARCRVGRTDLSAWLVEQGWARPREGGGRLASLHDEARSAGAGQFSRP